MYTFRLENFSFAYEGQQNKALSNLNFEIEPGQFVTLCGRSGCGKTTLLRQLKPVLAPYGNREGSISFIDRPLEQLSQRDQAAYIGFVQQSPESQIVTDKVWHELAFGLESLGLGSAAIRLRVAEMAAFFGIEPWFRKRVDELSGGQKQLLNLAAVMVMQPAVLILDEPTSQLDPVAAREFLENLSRINRDLGTTIILSEHRLEEILPLSDRVIVLERGEILIDSTPRQAAEELRQLNHEMFLAMPTPIRVWSQVENDLPCPFTVREGRDWLYQFSIGHALDSSLIPGDKQQSPKSDIAVSLQEISFSYQRNGTPVLSNLSLEIKAGGLFALLGGNGAGKSTLLSLIAGINQADRGKILLNGKNISKISRAELYDYKLAMLPQNPASLFVKNTVYDDLMEMFDGKDTTQAEKEQRVQAVMRLCELEELQTSHPYDISGGEQQRAALGKVLLTSPQILLVDEPTKGLDSFFKQRLAHIFRKLQSRGTTIIMVSHDIEFCAEYADCCAMLFDGAIVAKESPRAFFGGRHFYTTAANRMARHMLREAILTADVVKACGGKSSSLMDNETKTNSGGDGDERDRQNEEDLDLLFSPPDKAMDAPDHHAKPKLSARFMATLAKAKQKLSLTRLLIGLLMLAAFVVAIIFSNSWSVGWPRYLYGGMSVSLLVAGIIALIPGQALSMPLPQISIDASKKGFTKRDLLIWLPIVILIPLTLYLGTEYLTGRKYYITSMLIILEALIPFFISFEGKKIQPKELVLLVVLIGITVASRVALVFLPQVKPVIALIIISGICFGREAGFLVGSLSAFISNFFLTQGAWTPWQMFSFGLIGFVAGLAFYNNNRIRSKLRVSVFGVAMILLVFAPIMNLNSFLFFSAETSWPAFVTTYALGMPFDILHAAATAGFLFLLAPPMIEKLERIKIKYGLLSRPPAA